MSPNRPDAKLRARATGVRAGTTSRWRRFALALAALTAAAVAAIQAGPSTGAVAVEPELLAEARVIRTEVNARYRSLPGRKVVVREATSTGVVPSLTLVTDWLQSGHVIPADNGVYFSLCSPRATCPYPARSAAWPDRAFLPRRLALELALRTLAQTSVDLVVISLPTASPVWVVVERGDLLPSLELPTALHRLMSHPAVNDPQLVELVDRITMPRLFVPLFALAPPEGTIFAVSLSLTDPPAARLES